MDTLGFQLVLDLATYIAVSIIISVLVIQFRSSSFGFSSSGAEFSFFAGLFQAGMMNPLL